MMQSIPPVKKQVVLALIFSLVSGYYGFSNADTLHLDEVTITGRRAPVVYSDLARVVTIIKKEEINQLPAHSISEILNYVMSVDVRERGSSGAQADLNMRGGSFEQVLVLLNGINMNDPQTGHHHLNLPVDPATILQIEILEGPGSRIFGPYAYAGAINIITTNEKEDELALSITGGEHAFFSGSFSLRKKTGPISHGLSISRRQSEGHRENTDFHIQNVFYQAVSELSFLRSEIQTGVLQKRFGANSFYSPLFPEQFEKIRSGFVSIKNAFGAKRRFTQTAYFRRHHDKFELFRYQPAEWYTGHNYHRTDVYGADINYYFPWEGGTTAAGIEFRSEQILSNVLGEPLSDTIWLGTHGNGYFNKGKTRSIMSFFGEHTLYMSKFTATLGVLGNLQEDYGFYVYPGIDISYSLSGSVNLIASWNKSLRMPSFTDLYYHGPTNFGNPDLRPEEANQLEVGLKANQPILSGHVLAFYRHGKNTIDWVRIADSLKWQSMNLTELSTFGMDFRARVSMDKLIGKNFPVKTISAGYSWIDLKKESGNFLSNYALDYLRKRFYISVHHDLLNAFNVSWHLNYQDRAGSYTSYPDLREIPYQPYATLDVRISLKKNNYRLFAEGTNLFNIQYMDFGNIPLAGRWLRAGLQLVIPLKY
jgi:vitamin B12 transporter